MELDLTALFRTTKLVSQVMISFEKTEIEMVGVSQFMYETLFRTLFAITYFQVQ